MKPVTTCVLALSVLTLLGQGRTAHAQFDIIHFPNDATIDYALAGDAEIGRDANGYKSSPTVNLVTGGSISDGVTTFSSSVFNVSGGSIGTDNDSLFVGIDAVNTSTVNFSGGYIAKLAAEESSVFNMSGGRIGSDLQAYDNSTINIRGGDPGPGMSASSNSTLNFFGHNLQATFKTEGGGVKFYSLSGTLADGTVLTDRFLVINPGGAFTLNDIGAPPPDVPEPGSLALLCGLSVMGIGLLRRQQRR